MSKWDYIIEEMRSDDDAFLFGEVPSKEEILSGNAKYLGRTLVYRPDIHEEANHTSSDHIEIGPKFFERNDGMQRYILAHEVAHELADEYFMDNSFDVSPFVKEKHYPPGSQGYKQLGPNATYFEGLFGAMRNAPLETLSDAFVCFFTNPDFLKKRSIEENGNESAYDAIARFLQSRGMI